MLWAVTLIHFFLPFLFLFEQINVYYVMHRPLNGRAFVQGRSSFGSQIEITSVELKL